MDLEVLRNRINKDYNEYVELYHKKVRISKNDVIEYILHATSVEILDALEANDLERAYTVVQWRTILIKDVQIGIYKLQETLFSAMESGLKFDTGYNSVNDMLFAMWLWLK